MSDIMDMDKADMAAELSKLRKEVANLRVTVTNQSDWFVELMKAQQENKALKQALQAITVLTDRVEEYL